MKNILRIAIAIFALTVLNGCENKNDATKNNFAKAINVYFEKHGDFCFQYEYPVKSLIPMDYDVNHALANLGLLNESPIMKDGFIKYVTFSLSEKAKPFIKEIIYINGTGHQKLCLGKKKLDTITKWEGPIKFGDYQQATVFYTYKIDSLAEWAKDPNLLKSYGDISTFISNEKSPLNAISVHLTSNGWEASNDLFR